MSYKLKNIYTKPNAEVNINFWDEDGSKASAVKDLIDTYFDAGKITQKPVKVVDGLIDTYSTIFKDEASYDEFRLEQDTILANETKRDKYCSDNSISWSVTDGDGVAIEGD